MPINKKFMIAFFALLIPTITHAGDLTRMEPKPGDPPTDEFVIEANRVYIPESKFVKEDDKFNLNWKAFPTLTNNKNEVKDVEKLINSDKAKARLSVANRTALSSMYHKLGTYYVYVANDPDVAIARFNKADSFNVEKSERNDVIAQLAYAYAEKYENSANPQDKAKAIFYLNKYSQANVAANEYSARNALAIGETYLKLDDAQRANKQLMQAAGLYQKVYGANSQMLAAPYELLAESYNRLLDDQTAEVYMQRAYHLQSK